jgi:hypothetical protein
MQLPYKNMWVKNLTFQNVNDIIKRFEQFILDKGR